VICHLSSRDTHVNSFVVLSNVGFKLRVACRRRHLLLILHKDPSPVEVYATFTELSVALLDVGQRCKQHQYATLDTAVDSVDKAAQVSETLANVLILEVKLKLVSVKISAYD
jgi:hypothetical protein